MSRLLHLYYFDNLLPTMTNTTFMSNDLRSRRKAAGLFQSDVARALGLDCADRISHWENGTAMPNVVNLFKLAAIYGVMPHELYSEFHTLVQQREPEDELS